MTDYIDLIKLDINLNFNSLGGISDTVQGDVEGRQFSIDSVAGHGAEGHSTIGLGLSSGIAGRTEPSGQSALNRNGHSVTSAGGHSQPDSLGAGNSPRLAGLRRQLHGVQLDNAGNIPSLGHAVRSSRVSDTIDLIA